MKRIVIVVCEAEESSHFEGGARALLYKAPLYEHAHRKIMDASNKLGLNAKFISVDAFDKKGEGYDISGGVEHSDIIAVVSPFVFLAPAKTIEDALKCIINNKFTYATVGISGDLYAVFGFGEMIGRGQEIASCADFVKAIRDSGAVYTHKALLEKEKATPISRIDYFKKIEDYRNELLDYFVMSGVEIENRDGIVIGPSCVIRSGCKILPNTQIYNCSSIKEHCVIGPNTVIDRSLIGEDTIIEGSRVSNAVIEDNVTIKRYSVIENNCKIGENVVIHNGCSLENSEIGANSVIYPHAVLVEAKLGKNVIFGSNAVTVKPVVDKEIVKSYQCRIGDNAIVGCNASLIAPIELGNNALVAAGSVITDSVPQNAFAISREFQEIKENRAKKRKRF